MGILDKNKINDNAYWFICYINPLELAEGITATLKNGEETILVDTGSDGNGYKAVSYITTAKQQYAGDEKLIALLNALQDYGHYMLTTDWRDNLKPNNEHAQIDAVTAITVDNDAAGVIAALADTEHNGANSIEIVRNLDNTGVEQIKFSLVLNDKTAMKYTVVLSSGATIESTNFPIEKGNGVFLTKGIGPLLLGKMETFSVKTKDTETGTEKGTATITACPMSYVHAILTGDFTNAQKIAMVAYYRYWQAALAYQASLNQNSGN